MNIKVRFTIIITLCTFLFSVFSVVPAQSSNWSSVYESHTQFTTHQERPISQHQLGSHQDSLCSKSAQSDNLDLHDCCDTPELTNISTDCCNTTPSASYPMLSSELTVHSVSSQLALIHVVRSSGSSSYASSLYKPPIA